MNRNNSCPDLQLAIVSPSDWRVRAGAWRWLILSALGAAPVACGGRTPSDGSRSANADLQEGSNARVASEPAAPADAAGGGAGGTSGELAGGAGGSLEPPLSEPSACGSSRPVGGGWLRCDNGLLHRETLGQCASAVPRSEPLVLPPEYAADAGVSSECRRDADCTARPHGHCELSSGLSPSATYCRYGCVVDSDCGAGQVCLCGDLVGECRSAACTTDADCEEGLLCADYDVSPGCGGRAFACQTARDECATPNDCDAGHAFCRLESIEDPRRVCSGIICAIGRPFLVDGCERLAPAIIRDDWYSLPANTSSRGLTDPALRAELARGWTEQGLMEHASIAAFARFSLQLLSLGAPAELVAGAAEAMQDEIRHARSCFELARKYSDTEVGPGALALGGALDDFDLVSIVVATVEEGCIGETVAAIEAAEALAHCTDTAAGAALERITADETRHAELAWQFVAWALATGPAELSDHVRRAFRKASEALPPEAPPWSAADRDLLRHGLVSPSLRAALRARVLREVIAPCAEALLESARPPSPRITDQGAGPTSKPTRQPLEAES